MYKAILLETRKSRKKNIHKLFINTYNLSFKIAEIFVVFFSSFLYIYWQIIKYHIRKIIKIALNKLLLSTSQKVKPRILNKGCFKKFIIH